MTAEGYEYLPHPADAKFRARGKTLEEAFANSARALAGLMWDCRGIEASTEISVEVDGRDREQLLVKFLSEILYLLDTRGFLLCSFGDLSIDEKQVCRLQAVFRGGEISSGTEIFGSVKAVTYSELKIERTESGEWAIEVVVDA
jgi:SHS2 domain-containing protein